MADFDVADLALQAIAPGNRLLYDDMGLPSVMVYVPKFRLSEVLTGGADTYHPAFIINGTVVDGIYISKYQNVVEDGRAYSLPGRDPKTSITWDTARGYCEAKGTGWHMMTKAEWAMLGLWCKAHGVFPKGNNQYGKDSTETAYTAIPATYGTGTDAGKIYHTATGTGPLTWSHDGTMKGIMDLNGNKVDGARKPSSEWDMHSEFYRKKPDCRAVVHTHSSFCTTFACLRMPIQAVHYVLADANAYEIPCTDYHTFGTPELAEDAVKTCGTGDAVLLANHGIIVCGKTLKSAFGLAKNLEFIAQLQYQAMCIGKPFVLGKSEMDEVFESFKSYGQPNSGKKGY